jgi:hypothetical protein
MLADMKRIEELPARSRDVRNGSVECRAVAL